MKVAVSYLKSDDYKKCISKIENTKADYIHVDMCDGKYVETKNFTISQIISLLKNSKKPLDIHLMCKEPIKYVNDLALLNVETITIHLDGCKDPLNTINYIKNMGIKVGIASNPDDNLELLTPYLSLIDEVLIMSVLPGKGGQVFIPKTVEKIDLLNEIKDKYKFITAIDGGINSDTINLLDSKKIDLVISGSYITESEDYEESIKNLKIINY